MLSVLYLKIEIVIDFLYLKIRKKSCIIPTALNQNIHMHVVIYTYNYLIIKFLILIINLLKVHYGDYTLINASIFHIIPEQTITLLQK